MLRGVGLFGQAAWAGAGAPCWSAAPGPGKALRGIGPHVAAEHMSGHGRQWEAGAGDHAALASGGRARTTVALARENVLPYCRCWAPLARRWRCERAHGGPSRGPPPVTSPWRWTLDPRPRGRGWGCEPAVARPGRRCEVGVALERPLDGASRRRPRGPRCWPPWWRGRTVVVLGVPRWGRVGEARRLHGSGSPSRGGAGLARSGPLEADVGMRARRGRVGGPDDGAVLRAGGAWWRVTARGRGRSRRMNAMVPDGDGPGPGSDRHRGAVAREA